MYCGQCGKQIDEDSRFCRFCGAAQKLIVESGSETSVEPILAPEVAATGAAAETQPKPKTGPIIGTVAVVLLLIIIIANQRSATDADADNGTAVAAALEAEADALEAAANNATAPVESVTPADPWRYSTDEDKVRRATSYYAQTTSTNSIRQDFPYEGATTGTLMVRKSPAYGTDVMFSISSGQLLCPSWDGCSGTVSFDGGPPQRVGFNAASDNSSDTIFVEGAKSFIAKLKKAKKVVVEVELYQAGRPQFEFDVQGLKWDH